MKMAILGSGDIFYRILAALNRGEHQVVSIATNRGNFVDDKKLASLNVMPEILCDHKEIIQRHSDIDALLLCSYAPLIEKEYFEKYLFINIHYALLPKYRGFHGFIWGMINGESQMGYSIFKVNEVIDGGPIYFQHAFAIEDKDTLFYVRERIENHIEENIATYMMHIEDGQEPSEQDEDSAIYVTKRKQNDGEINWEWSEKLIYNHIRALVPPLTPGAYTYYKGEKVVLLEAKWKKSEQYFSTCGKIVNITGDGSIYVKCGDGIIEITKISINNMEIEPAEIFKSVGILLGIKSITEITV